MRIAAGPLSQAGALANETRVALYRPRPSVELMRRCAFVGDSPTDVLAGLLAGVPVIGFANKPGKAEALTLAGARAVTDRLSDISAALLAAPGQRCRISRT